MIELKVEGMTCGHCEQAVRQALAAVPGVTAVLEVDRGQQRAAVEGNPDPTALIAAIKDEGFQAHVT
ncbi:MAG: heavy-metal-associated domain-containing protein [Chromatiaceae bacterium]|nr:heavy-metal-associated domain-containing protein [Chromatiaceae bacterium]